MELHAELSDLALVVSFDPELSPTVLKCLGLTKSLLALPKHVQWFDIFEMMIMTLSRIRTAMSPDPIASIHARLPIYLQPPVHQKE